MTQDIETHPEDCRRFTFIDNSKVLGPAIIVKKADIPNPFDEIRYFFRMIDFAKEIGRPSNAAHCIRKIEEMMVGPMEAVWAGRIASAKDWVLWATNYEFVHGKESLLDTSHPIHLRAIEMIEGR